ncbi:hypothetical protein CEP45_04025 [Mergibacter septicus]|uniref:tyrosine-type recombinase/integrase n=1 Tax=Mergibacter septicus TaxID=221402 RepID=UPI001C748AE3|nr:site-specific integrase [Mergibacter septicus]QDJ13068.1 hypothetical protein CEP45_04025 [Mergibacter septicus]
MKLGDVLAEWIDVRSQKTKQSTNKNIVRILNRNYQHLFNLDCVDIKPRKILDATQNNSISTYDAKRALAAITSVFDYACVLDIIQNNPAARLTKFIQSHNSVNRKHLKSEHEFIKLLRDINKSNSSKSIINALLVLIYTAQRRSEIIPAKWGEIDFYNRLWNIPAERMKMKQDHVIPLSETVINILNEQKKLSSEYVFPSSKKINYHINKSAPISVLYVAGYKKKQTIHGFRTLFSTIAHSSGLWSSDAIEMQLAHKITGVRGVYNKSNYLEERVRMMSWYAKQLDFWRTL